MKPARVGICGVGTVGQAVFAVLERNASEITRRAGRDIEVSVVGMRRDRDDFDPGSVRVERDVLAVARDPDVDVLVELIGGVTTARELVMMAIAEGKQVVTANKALIAEHGNEIFAAAHEKGVNVAFEAAVAGGIPLIKALREGLSANRIDWLAGIINGTSNYVLSEMRLAEREFADVLAEAQRLGYAEADPTFDVEGIDAAHKLTILASIAFGVPLQFSAAYTEGIGHITREDIAYAEELGYRIKPLALTRRTEHGIELRVHPTLVPERQLIANVDGVMNAVLVHSDTVGPTLYYGPGAGGGPTASSVVADLLDVVRGITAHPNQRVPHLAFQPDALSDVPFLPMSEVVSAYYLRIFAQDRPGVLARVATILSEQGISIEALIQKEQAIREIDEDAWVPIIILTHRVREAQLEQALVAIESLEETRGRVMRIRVESLDNEA
ncbi:MAG: homoserine dehydrogenase [Gammaproteobacteria bacterium]|nr:homoserine dehydrogenase [Gammaproteobacteria bacterium]